MTRRLPVDRSFSLDATLNGEQDFRWRPLKDGWHSGVLSGRLIHVRQYDGGVEYRADSDLDALLSSSWGGKTSCGPPILMMQTS